jgi:hypoxanthine phosphoribosyltransferase
MDKRYIGAQELLEDSFRLGLKVLADGFRPNFIVGVWRGGTPVGIAVQEILSYFGVETDHIAIRTSLYTAPGQRGDKVRVHGLGYLIKSMNAEDSLLIVDDVYDSGLSIQAVLHSLRLKGRRNTPHDIRIATPWFKPSNNRTDRVPEYYLHETDEWLVFPHELEGLTREEIEAHKTGLAAIFEELEREAGREISS